MDHINRLTKDQWSDIYEGSPQDSDYLWIWRWWKEEAVVGTCDHDHVFRDMEGNEIEDASHWIGMFAPDRPKTINMETLEAIGDGE